ncbi:MAG: NIPSNAP family protein [Opitutales bacterium]
MMKIKIPFLFLFGALAFAAPYSYAEEAPARTACTSSCCSVMMQDYRTFEMRTYYAADGKLDALHERFRNHTIKLFEKHGMTNLGYWVPQENPENKLIYVLAFPSREARDNSFGNFVNDPEWQEAYEASHADGVLVDRIESVFLKATDYSPIIFPSWKKDGNRTFELRTYTAHEGKLEDLHERFRNHTTALFARHGITNIGYWTPTEADDGSENTLVYVVAHKSRDGAAESFDAFRNDPEWQAVYEASRVDGPLVEGIESVFMNPVDYSSIR